ncbi:MAG: EAL domain-containing protein, partial [Lachnospiraceae bacterium]|nr:EAL domain-containing protein [Lachnospiraceae bacterium]
GDNEAKSRYILKTLIILAQEMDLKVVVEGVETKQQVEFLRTIGKNYVQGYYFSRPVDGSIYKEMLEKFHNEKQ